MEVSQGSLLSPLLLRIFHCDMCFLMIETEFASYADNDVIKMLENDSIRPFKWFSDNQMKANKYKCHLNVSNNEYVFIKLMI